MALTDLNIFFLHITDIGLLLFVVKIEIIFGARTFRQLAIWQNNAKRAW
jgi:hypothetical protein